MRDERYGTRAAADQLSEPPAGIICDRRADLLRSKDEAARLVIRFYGYFNGRVRGHFGSRLVFIIGGHSQIWVRTLTVAATDQRSNPPSW